MKGFTRIQALQQASKLKEIELESHRSDADSLIEFSIGGVESVNSTRGVGKTLLWSPKSNQSKNKILRKKKQGSCSPIGIVNNLTGQQTYEKQKQVRSQAQAPKNQAQSQVQASQMQQTNKTGNLINRSRKSAGPTLKRLGQSKESNKPPSILRSILSQTSSEV